MMDVYYDAEVSMMIIGRHWLRCLVVTVLIGRGGEGAVAAAAIGSKCLRLPFLRSGEKFQFAMETI